jgi:hypothetical protein
VREFAEAPNAINAGRYLVASLLLEQARCGAVRYRP